MMLGKKWKEEIDAMARVRGNLVNAYAQIEYSIGHLLVATAHLDDYRDLERRLPRNLEHRASALRKLLTFGPYEPYADRLGPILDKATDPQLAALRHLIVHGLCIFDTFSDGRSCFQFSRYVFGTKGTAPTSEVRRLTSAELSELEKLWVPLASDMIKVMQALCTEWNIGSMLDPAPLGFKAG